MLEPPEPPPSYAPEGASEFPVSLNGQLLAVEETKTSIYVYSPALSSWSKLGCFPFDPVRYPGVEYLLGLSVRSDELLIIESRLCMQYTANKVGITV